MHLPRMMLTGTLLLAAMAAIQAQPAEARMATTSMAVGATVVRPEPQPLVRIERGAVTVRDAGSAIVTIDRADPRLVLVTLTY